MTPSWRPSAAASAGVEDADARQGRDKSLGASLDYGFRQAFQDDELPIVALLHLFQGTVDVDALHFMGKVGERALPELEGRSREQLTGLLERAKETGLLNHLGGTWFTIHPALPWFLRQLFVRCYDGQAGRSPAQAALRAWVESVGALGSYYHEQYNEGNRDVMNFLGLEEANLLHARRLARRNQWWNGVISAMQGLDELYGFQGRTAEWARLVEEIRSDYCTDDNEHMPGREDQYNLVMEYRINLARSHERDLTKAAALQEKIVRFNRQRAAAALSQPADAPLDSLQRNRLRTLGISLSSLGHILREEENAECVKSYQDSIRIFQRFDDKLAEAISENNLGHAYKDISAICDLDVAEAAYQRSLDLFAPNDALNRSLCIKQIGMVHHDRFSMARQRNEPAEKLLRHAHAAERHYLEALRMCPEEAVTALAPIHNGLGNLYSQVGQFENARVHFELDAQYEEKSGNCFGAGQTRFNIAVMYVRVAEGEDQTSQQRASLLRARAYAEAALRDFQHYQGRAVKGEAGTQALLDLIAQALEKLPL